MKMSKLTNELKQLLGEVHTMQQAFSGADYYTKLHPWFLSLVSESVELQSELRWQWWKNQEPNACYVLYELTDVLISGLTLVNLYTYSGTDKDLREAKTNAIASQLAKDFLDEDTFTSDASSIDLCSELIYSALTTSQFNSTVFGNLVQDMNLSWDIVILAVRHKIALNLLRLEQIYINDKPVNKYLRMVPLPGTPGEYFKDVELLPQLKAVELREIKSELAVALNRVFLAYPVVSPILTH